MQSIRISLYAVSANEEAETVGLCVLLGVERCLHRPAEIHDADEQSKKAEFIWEEAVLDRLFSQA